MTKEVKDFTGTVDREPLRFKIDDDVFEAVPRVGAELFRDVINAGNVADLAELQGKDLSDLTNEQAAKLAQTVNLQTEKAMMFLDTVLLPDSALRFAERLRSATEPITFTQAYDVWRWLLGEYGGRPTEPSSPSSSGYDGTGMSSTAGASATA
jgi:hypothetical protein